MSDIDTVIKRAFELLNEDRSARALMLVWHKLASDTDLLSDATRGAGDAKVYINAQTNRFLDQFRRDDFFFRILLDVTNPLRPAQVLLALLVALDKLRSPEEEGCLGGHSSTTAANGVLETLPDDSGLRYYVVRRNHPFPAQGRIAQEVDSLLAWHPHHAFVPERYFKGDRTRNWRIDLKHLPSNVDERLRQAIADGQPLKFFAGHFNDGVALRPTPAGEFLAQGLDAPDRRHEAILEMFAAAVAQNAHIVVLPELTVTPALRDEISAWLDDNRPPFMLVVPGSFHEMENGIPRSRACLLDYTGTPQLWHRKLVRYGKWEAVHEAHTLGDSIEILDTPYGLLALPICKDLSDEEDMQSGTIWRALGCDLLLVPSMSPATGMRAHVRAGQAAERRLSGIVAIANQWDVAEAEDHGSAIHSPRRIDSTERQGGGKLHGHLIVEIQFLHKMNDNE